MTNQEKDKYICQQLGVVKPFWENFTSEAGRIELLELMKAHKNYEDFADKLFVVCYWLKEKAVYAVPEPYMTDNTGKLRDEVFRWMGGEG